MGRSTGSLILDKMRSAIFFIFLFLLVSSSYAYDCNIFSGIDYQNCIELNATDESQIANILYTNTSFPDFDFVKVYNQNIIVTAPPNNITLNNSGIIRNAWIDIVTISPSIYFENQTYVPKTTEYRVETGYSITLPTNYYNSKKSSGKTCQILYSKSSDQSSINWLIDGKPYGAGKITTIVSDNYRSVQAQSTITAVTKADVYIWNRYCCSRVDGYCQKYCYDCKYSKSTYTTDKITITDTANIVNYIHNPLAEFTIIDNYADTYKGKLEKDNETNVLITFNNASLTEQKYVYSAKFSDPPYNFMNLVAEKRDTKSLKNIIVSNGNIYVNDAGSCTLEKSDFFSNQIEECKVNITENAEAITPSTATLNLSFLFRLIVFAFILVVIYKSIKKYWGKALVPIAIVLLMIPSVSAAEDCGLANLASCIPQKIYDFFLNLINAPLEPLLNSVKHFLSESPNITLFQGIWAIIIYCISLFYGLLFVYAGYMFLFSGHDVIRREMAKEWLKNTVIMIVLIQASFYLYGLFVDLGSIMSSTILSMVDPHFFMLTADNLTNIGLELLLTLLYAVVLVITLLFLIIRYLVVAFGVLFLPIGIFCYFIPPLRSYGKLILNLLGLMIFVTFIDAIIILACSKLIALPTFASIKILVMITCFLMINIVFIILGKHIISKTSLDDVAGKAMQAGKYIGGML